MKKYSAVAGLALLALACDKIGGGSVNLNTDEKKAGYAIGQQIGQSFKMQNVSPDIDAVVAGMKYAIKGEK